MPRVPVTMVARMLPQNILFIENYLCAELFEISEISLFISDYVGYIKLFVINYC
jgi:hypothetical protein